MTEKIRKLFRASAFFMPDFPFCLERMRHTPADYNEQYSCRREFWKIIYVLSGSGWKVINERRYPLKPGSLFLIHPLDQTTFIIESPQIEIYNILFMPELIAAGMRELKNDFNFFSIFSSQLDRELTDASREQLYVLDSNNEIESLIHRLEREYQREAPNYRSFVKLQLLELLILISRLGTKKAQRQRHQDIVSFIADVIDRHYAEDFDYDYLAAQIGIAQSHMCRLYRAATGGTISAALRRRRLAAAREKLLSAPDKSISEICYECGFGDLSHFYRLFTAEYGLNPGCCRRHGRSD